MRKRKLVGNQKQVQRKCQTSAQYWLSANRFPTLQAIYRHLGLLSLIKEFTHTLLHSIVK